MQKWDFSKTTKKIETYLNPGLCMNINFSRYTSCNCSSSLLFEKSFQRTAISSSVVVIRVWTGYPKVEKWPENTKKWTLTSCGYSIVDWAVWFNVFGRSDYVLSNEYIFMSVWRKISNRLANEYGKNPKSGKINSRI